MKVLIQGPDLLMAVQAQRNEAMDDAANKQAVILQLNRRIEELEKQLKDKDGSDGSKAD